MTHEVINIKKCELEIMCAIVGMNSVVGLGMGGEYKPDRAEVIEIVGVLIRDKIIELKDGNMLISESVSRIIKIIRSAEIILFIGACDLHETRKCCYVSHECTAVCEPSSVETDTFRICVVDNCDLAAMLEGDGYIVGTGDNDRRISDVVLEEADENIVDLIKMSSIGETSEEYMFKRCKARLVIDVLDPRSGECIKRIGRSRLTLNDIMFIIEKDELARVELWDRDQFVKILDDVMRGAAL